MLTEKERVMLEWSMELLLDNIDRLPYDIFGESSEDFDEVYNTFKSLKNKLYNL